MNIINTNIKRSPVENKRE